MVGFVQNVVVPHIASRETIARKNAEVRDPGSKLISYNFVRTADCEATQSFEKDGVNAGLLRTSTLNCGAAQQ